MNEPTPLPTAAQAVASLWDTRGATPASMAAAAIDAERPAIEAATRTRVAAEILAHGKRHRDGVNKMNVVWGDGHLISDAERDARRRSEKACADGYDLGIAAAAKVAGEGANDCTVANVDQAAEELRAVLQRITSAGYDLRWVVAAGSDYAEGVEVSSSRDSGRIVWQHDTDETWSLR